MPVRWREALSETLGPSGRLIVDLSLELVLIIRETLIFRHRTAQSRLQLSQEHDPMRSMFLARRIGHATPYPGTL